MHNNLKPLTLAVAVATATVSGHAMAGAFQLNEQSVSAQGTSFAGRASTVNDASIVYGNPAGMSFLDRAQVTGGVTYLMPETDIDNVSGSATGSNDGDMVPNKAIPFAYFVQPINPNLHFGLGVYAPFGLITDYESDFQGRYFGDYSEVKVATVQPTISVKFSEQFSAGFGVTYNRIDGKLGSRTPGGPVGYYDSTGAFTPTGSEGDGRVVVEGDDEAWGFTWGMMYKPWQHTTIGLAYHSEVDYDLEGDASFENVRGQGDPVNHPVLGPIVPVGAASAKSDASLGISLPASWDLGVTHELNDQWTLMGGVTLVKWGSFEELNVENDVREINEVQNYKDSWQYALGASYQMNEQWVFRGGVAYDQSPIRDEDRTVRVPSGDRMIYSVGAGWTPVENLTVDVAYTYLDESSAELSEQDPTRGTYEADYDNSANGFGAQVTYRF
ncbi:OmpP1/FadL family transporter [Halomonas huangheensis]|nr:outer membrane protein transport protein [Halomonas huangheensis]